MSARRRKIGRKIKALTYKSLGHIKKIARSLTLIINFALTLVLISLAFHFPGIKAASAESLDLTGTWLTEAQVTSGPYSGYTFSGWMNLTQSGTNLTGTFSSNQYSGTCSGTYSNGTMSLLGVATNGYRLYVTATVSGTGQQIQGTWRDNIGDSGTYAAVKTATSISGIEAVSKIQSFFHWPKDFIQEPVDSATGAHHLERTLLSCHGTQDLVFKIQYNSLLLSKDYLGNGWSHDYEAYLSILSENSIKIHWNANCFNLFNGTGDGQFTSSDLSTKHDKLIKNTDGTYTLTRKDHSVYQFNTSGKLTQLQNGYGQVLNMTYDTSGHLIRIIEPVSNQALTLHYNGAGLIDTVTDNLGRQVSFTYDASNNLTMITDANGNRTTYAYTPQGYVQSAADNSDNVMFTNTYDSQGRVITQHDGMPDHQPGTFSYDETSQPGYVVTTYTDRNGNTRTLVHDSNYNLVSETDELGNTTAYTYDADGNRTSTTDPLNHTTTYTYDIMGNLLTTTDPAGYTTTYTYDANNNLLTETNPAGKTTSYAYNDINHPNNPTSITDPLNYTTTYTYDSNGLLLTKTNPRSGTTTYAYHGGLLQTVTDPEGVTTSYGYDAAGRLVSITDGAGKTTSYAYDHNDNLLSRTDPLGNTESYTYDCRGNRLTETDAKGNTSYYTYNNNNKPIEKVDALGSTTTFSYDGEDRLVSTTDPLGHTTIYNYDAKSRLIGITDANGNTSTIGYDAVDNVVYRTDALGNRIQTISYDVLNNPITLADALNRTTTNQYDSLSRLTKVTDPLGNVTQYHYDDLNRLTSATDALSGQASQTFDADGNRTSLTDPNGNQTSFTYDSADRLVSQTQSSGGIITYTYNNRGLRAQMTNARGQVTTYQYDDAGRLASFTDPAGTVSYTYDPNGNVLTVNDAVYGVITRTYDALNRVTSYTDTQGNTIQYAYDPVGNLTTLTYPGGRQVHYTYDPANRLTSVTDWANRTTTYQYDQNNRLMKTTRPDGSVLTMIYDAAGQLLQQKDVDANGKVVAQYDYTYDNVGNPLTEQTVPHPQPFYLPNTVCAYTYDNRIDTYNSQPVTYDNDGNMTYGPLTGVMSTYTYDVRNRLTTVDTTTYLYDAENNRIGVADSVYQIYDRYVINPQATFSQVLIKTDAQGNKTYYVYGLGLIGQEDSNGNYLTYHFDRRGSTVALTDISGNVTDTFQYAPYGELVNRTSTTTIPFLYCGQYGVMTDHNGLYYMRARYYNPEIKRFIIQDVLLSNITMTQTVNRYMYVNAKPINYCDPLGLWTFAIGLTGSLGAGGGITGSFDITFDSQGNLGVLISGGGGGYGGVSASGGFNVLWTNANSLNDIQGQSYMVGGSGGEGPLTFGGNVVIGNTYKGGEIEWTPLSAGTPINEYGMITYSKAVYFNIPSAFRYLKNIIFGDSTQDRGAYPTK